MTRPTKEWGLNFSDFEDFWLHNPNLKALRRLGAFEWYGGEINAENDAKKEKVLLEMTL